MSFFPLHRYAATVTLTFKDGESLQIHEFLYSKLGLAEDTTDDVTRHPAPTSLDISAQAGYVLVDYLYGGVPDFNTLLDAVSTRLPATIGEKELCVKLVPVVEILLELSCCLGRHEDLDALVEMARNAFDQVATRQSPLAILMAMRTSLSRMNLPAMRTQHWLQNQISGLVAKMAPTDLNSFATSLNTDFGDGTAKSLDKQMFLGSVFNSLIISNNNYNNTGISAVGLEAMQPSPDLKRQILELSASVKEAQKWVDRISYKKLKKAMIVDNNDYEFLQEIIPKLRDYFVNMEEKLRVVTEAESDYDDMGFDRFD